MKDVHELRLFTIVKLASSTSRLDSLEGAMQSCRTEVVQVLAKLEALEKHMGVAEDVLVHARLREVRADIQKTNEEISTVQGFGRQQQSSYKDWIQRWKCPSSETNNKSRVDYKIK